MIVLPIILRGKLIEGAGNHLILLMKLPIGLKVKPTKNSLKIIWRSPFTIACMLDLLLLFGDANILVFVLGVFIHISKILQLTDTFHV